MARFKPKNGQNEWKQRWRKEENDGTADGERKTGIPEFRGAEILSELRHCCHPAANGTDKEVLFRPLPVPLEKHTSEAGELEDDKNRRLPVLRQGVPCFQGIQEETKILQPSLRQSWQSGREESQDQRRTGITMMNLFFFIYPQKSNRRGKEHEIHK